MKVKQAIAICLAILLFTPAAIFLIPAVLITLLVECLKWIVATAIGEEFSWFED